MLLILLPQEINLVLGLRYNRSDRFSYVDGLKMYQLKLKEIKWYQWCLGKISIDFTVDSMKKTTLNGYVHDFLIDYNTSLATLQIFINI